VHAASNADLCLNAASVNAHVRGSIGLAVLLLLLLVGCVSVAWFDCVRVFNVFCFSDWPSRLDVFLWLRLFFFVWRPPGRQQVTASFDAIFARLSALEKTHGDTKVCTGPQRNDGTTSTGRFLPRVRAEKSLGIRGGASFLS
jgi:hypothetical protein